MPDLITKLAQHVELIGDRPALVGDLTSADYRTLSWRELGTRIDGWVGGFRARGLEPGDRIGVAHYSGILGIEIYLAAQAAGLVPVLLGIELGPHVATAVDSLAIQEIFTGPELALPLHDLQRPGLLIWESVAGDDVFAKAAAPGSERTWGEPRGDAVISAIQYSSGTTGVPKGIARDVGCDYYDAVNRCLGMRARHSERWICASPKNISVALGATRCMVLLGGTIVALDDVSTESIEVNTRAGVTIFPLQAPGWRELIESGVADQLPERGLRVAVSTGQRTPRVTLDRLRDLMAGRGEVVNSYGLTETSTLALSTSSMASYDVPLSVGTPSVLTTLRVEPLADPKADPGGAGEIVVAGPAVFPGYLDAAGSLLARAEPAGDGWFRTGDVGRWDAAGNLSVLGRWSDAIVHEGRYIFPYALESLVADVDGVAEAVLVADRSTGLALVLQSVAGTSISAAAIRLALGDAADSSLRILMVDEMPRRPSRKIDRVELAALVASGSARLAELV